MTIEVTVDIAEEFQRKIFSWWETNQRDFPWRHTNDPYRILVSEFMLQQTQTSRVVSKYEAFLGRFPTPQSLAEAPQEEVLRLWQGLGYNRRAIWLQEASARIKEYGFPRTLDLISRFKGLGPYAARSILIFAFNSDLATVDVNIRRILVDARFAEANTSEKDLFRVASLLLPKGRSRDWHNALMDYGAVLLKSSSIGARKQGKFEGSSRKFRGEVIKFLTKKSRASREELMVACGIPSEKIDSVLQSLVKDKLIHRETDEFVL